MALGIIDQDFQSSTLLNIENNDKVYLYSDGITEAINSFGDAFGQIRLELEINELLKSNAEIDILYESVQQFIGETKQFDDITLLELTC
jgi:serine phosphatase RsbU (regulator of sigma subunit)